MTLDEAIKHAEEVAEKFESLHETYENMDEDRLLFRRVEENECKNCAKEHRQLANWLKELKQLREQEHCEDAVSREQALKELKESAEHHANDSREEVLLRRDRDIIRALPPVTPTRKKGKWIGHGEHCENLGVIPSGLGAYEWCSNCDCGIDVREWHRNHYNYCPNCGCRMEREE